MSQQIPVSFVDQFSANIYFLAQQKGSRLSGMVRNESQSAESAFYDRIGSVTAQKRVGRHTDTQYIDTPHSRRRVTMEDYAHADLVDNVDKLRMIINPESAYSQTFMMALGRAMDDVIIENALGPASAGRNGGSTVNLADTNRIAGFDGATATGVGLNIATLRAVKKKFNQNEVEEGELFFAISAEQLDDLLGQTEITSSDFNVIKALVDGDVDSYMGFKFVRLERLPVTSAATTYDVADGSVGAGGGTLPAGARRCFAWKRDGIILATGMGVKTKIDELPTKNYSTQIFAEMTIGAVRMEEVKVVEVLCKE